jgi:hypothetical protein
MLAVEGQHSRTCVLRRSHVHRYAATRPSPNSRNELLSYPPFIFPGNISQIAGKASTLSRLVQGFRQ